MRKSGGASNEGLVCTEALCYWNKSGVLHAELGGALVAKPQELSCGQLLACELQTPTWTTTHKGVGLWLTT